MFICEECGQGRAFKIAEKDNRIHLSCPDCGAMFWFDRKTPEELLDETKSNTQKLYRILMDLRDEGLDAAEAIDEFKTRFDATFGKDFLAKEYPTPPPWLDGFFKAIEAHLKEAAREDGHSCQSHTDQ